MKSKIRSFIDPLVALGLASALILLALVSFNNNNVDAACNNTKSHGRIEADFVSPSDGSYSVWVKTKGPVGSVIVAGVEGQGCQSVTASTNTNNFTWVNVSGAKKANLKQGTSYMLNISADSPNVAIQEFKLINNECDPRASSTECATEATPVAPGNTAPIISGFNQTTTDPRSPATLNFTANISDDNSLKSVDLYNAQTNAKIASFTRHGSTNTYNATLSDYKEGSYSFYLIAVDSATSPLQTKSATIQVNVAAPIATPTPSNNNYYKAGTYDDSIFAYSSGWNISGNAAGENKYNGSDHWTMTAGATATLNFTGTGITVYGAKASWHGHSSVEIDGKPMSTIDQYNSTRQDQVAIFTVKGLTMGNHTIKIQNIDSKNPKSSNIISTIDKVQIIDTPGTDVIVNQPTKEETTPIATNKAPVGPHIIKSASLSYNGWAGGCKPETGCTITLSWDNATDDSGKISHYDIYNGSTKINTQPLKKPSFTHAGIRAGQTYSYRVFAFDEQGLTSGGSAILTKTVNCIPILWTAYCTI